MKKTHFFLDIYTKIKNINIILVRGIGCGKDEGATTTGDSVTCGVYIFKIYKIKIRTHIIIIIKTLSYK